MVQETLVENVFRSVPKILAVLSSATETLGISGHAFSSFFITLYVSFQKIWKERKVSTFLLEILCKGSPRAQHALL